MRYHDSDHFFEQQGSLICWIRNELKMNINDLSNYTKYSIKEIDEFEQGHTTSEDVNKFYDNCLKGIVRYANDSGQSFSEVMYHLSEVRTS